MVLKGNISVALKFETGKQMTMEQIHPLQNLSTGNFPKELQITRSF